MVSVGEYSGLKQPLQNIKTLKLGLGNHLDCGSSSKKNSFNINKEMVGVRNRSRCRLKQTQHRKRYFLCDTNSTLASTSADMTDPPVSLWVAWLAWCGGNSGVTVLLSGVFVHWRLLGVLRLNTSRW